MQRIGILLTDCVGSSSCVCHLDSK